MLRPFALVYAYIRVLRYIYGAPSYIRVYTRMVWLIAGSYAYIRVYTRSLPVESQREFFSKIREDSRRSRDYIRGGISCQLNKSSTTAGLVDRHASSAKKTQVYGSAAKINEARKVPPNPPDEAPKRAENVRGNLQQVALRLPCSRCTLKPSS